MTETEVNTLLSGKSDTGHTHTASDVTDFTNASRAAVTDNITYGIGWNGVIDQSPSKNAVYDVLETKADKSDLLTSDVTTTLTLTGTGITNTDNNNYTGTAGVGTVTLTFTITDARGSGGNISDIAYELEYEHPFTYSSATP